MEREAVFRTCEEDTVSTERLKKAAKTALQAGLNLRAGETVLIVTDSVLRDIGDAFHEAATAMGNESIYIEIIPRNENGEDPPEPVIEAMKSSDVVIAPTSKSLTHTPARRAACEAGARVATLPGITEDAMVRCLSADLIGIADRTKRIAQVLTGGKAVRITSPGGTDIRFSIDGIKAIASTGLIHHSGEFGNLPSGEAYLMPVEGSAEGVFVIDGSMAGIGSLLDTQPIIVKVSEGTAVEVTGGKDAMKLAKRLADVGDLARNIAEFGIGTNDAAKITGSILEDEKVSGTVHLALGNNVSMGGSVDVPLHLDGLIMKPKVELDGRVIMKDGEFLMLS